MTIVRLPVFQLVKTAYQDLWHVVHAMPLLVGCGLLIVLAASFVESAIPLSVWNTAVVGTVAGFLVTVARSFLLVPVLIATHRYILLGEVTPGYALEAGDPSFQAFFGWQVALLALSTGTSWIGGATQSDDTRFISAVAFLALTYVAVWIAVRLSILLPAIAVHARNANAKSAWADTKGHAFRIFLIFLTVSIPIGAIIVLELMMLEPGSQARGSEMSFFGMIISSPTQIALVILYVATASRVFQIIGQRLNPPA
jgi:hypothetical protein